MTGFVQALPTGILLPTSVLHSHFFAILASFVAINTVMYAALAIAKIVPMVHFADFVPGRRRRAETRGIHPDAATREQPGTEREPG
ncbi:hypothetical protein [Cryobacterium psychrophilum]|uniref:Uncharacterized protein n=1 Tax=Cryobacterium psychrophilum TaxID=41988 RepID=A0A4Y8KWH5_9MICO|nr:hypothetical protein [Cryobacterium psychrophilum]TDW28675.1 hypothetical protein EDD25_0302 [Cryobacterium psychrophilum]TFD82335.1 hypothetical protein E3T53_00190 [Cryobacterium psychrophilum]